jgi:hypothetical protein
MLSITYLVAVLSMITLIIESTATKYVIDNIPALKAEKPNPCCTNVFATHVAWYVYNHVRRVTHVDDYALSYKLHCSLYIRNM